MHQLRQEIPQSTLDIDYLITALDTVSEGLIIVDQYMNILYKNVASAFMLDGTTKSFTLEEFIQWKQHFRVFDLKSHKELNYNELPIVRAVHGLKFSNQLLHIIGSSGYVEVYLSCNGTPLIGKNHSIVGAVFTFRDITKRYLAEKRVNQEKAFYKNILDWIPAEVFVYSDYKNFVFTNHRAEKLLKDMAKIGWHPDEAANSFVKEHDAEVLKKLQAIEFDERMEYPWGTKHYHTIRFPIYHQSSEKVLICAIAFDVTEKLALESKLENERVNSINASKLAAIGTLAGEIGHEINAPIAILKGIVFMLRQMMMDKKLNGQILNDKLGVMDSTLNRIAKIIDSLKNLSRKSSNELKEACILRGILQDVVALSDLKFAHNHVKLHYDIRNPILDNAVDCYQIQFSQVLVNVLTNAADAVMSAEDRWVEIIFKEDHNYIYIQVKDSGPGIPDELRKKIFEPFFTTKKCGEGTGLGLSISKNIMEAHGGDIQIGPPEEGSSFIIKLPKVTPVL